ncbi:MAG TPA: hypothetical protein VJ835_00685 [Fimbriimonadaceae bacterium]|nr:hypothetical protein [Fimbriimonadaceae bacterium]
MNAGYSGTPLPKKLGIKPDSRVSIVRAVPGFEAAIEPFQLADSTIDILIAFCQTRAELEAISERRIEIEPDGSIWICWPKKSSKLPTEITENLLRDVLLPTGLVDNKVCAIDDQWSGLRFVWRKELRNSISSKSV